MTKTDLSPSGRKVLEAAYQGNGFLFSNSGGLRGRAAQLVRKSLLNAGLIAAVPHDGEGGFFDGRALRVTDAGKAALGAQKPATQPQDGSPAPSTAKKAPTPRQNSKQAKLVDMLRRPSGASIAQVCDAFGWQAHTARAAISTLPRKAGVEKPVSTMEGRERIYKLPGAGSA